MTHVGVVAAVAFASTVILCPLVIVLARRLGVVDRPGELKPQTHSVPLLGGVAVFLAVAAAVAWSQPAVLAALVAALLLGVADDRLSLPPWVRLVGQVAIAVAVAAEVRTRLPGAAGDAAVVVVSVTLMNGVNFLDGLDSLASVVLALSAGAFALMFAGQNRVLGTAVALALVGFLLYNRPPARVYLGDGGSYMLGTALSVLAARAWSHIAREPKSVASLLLIALPCAEVAFAVVRRMRARRSVTSGDRRHPYDMLRMKGWTVTAVASSYGAVQLVLACAALAASRSEEPAAAVVVVALASGALVVTGMLCGALTPDRELTP